MAQIRFSNLVNDIRGAVGGVTFSRSASGATVSARKSSRKSARHKRKSQSVPLPSLARSWRSLSEVDRSSWNLFAMSVPSLNKLGSPRTPSGFEVYTQRNSVLMSVGLSPVQSPPGSSVVPVKPIQSLLFRLAANGSLNAVSLGSGDNTVSVSMRLFMLPRSVSYVKASHKNQLIQVGSVVNFLGFGVSFFSDAVVVLDSGNFKVGQVVYAEYDFINPATGQVSPRYSIQSVVTSL